MHPPAAELADRLVAIDAVAAAEPASIRVVHAPGRVNLIGEHTDYNDGFVLPAAIDRGISIALVPTADRSVELTRLDTGERSAFGLDDLQPAAGRWIDYVTGMAWAMAAAGLPRTGFRGVLASDLPVGAGLSSSAALELAAAWALSAGERPATDTMALARLAQRAENEFVGVACGLMDQFAVSFGVADHALLLDCRSLEHRAVPLPAATRLVICHSGAPRTLATSEYNARRAACDRAVEILGTFDPGVRALRDATPELLEQARERLDDEAYRLARHVVTEDARVQTTVAALAAGDLETVGEALFASHRSLRDDFRVSSGPLDALVEIAASVPGVVGARLTGAGFGGCTVNFLRDDAVDALREAVEARYPAMTGLVPRVYAVRAALGAGRVA